MRNDPSDTSACPLSHAVHISEGKIVKVDGDVSINGSHVIDFKDLVISPGVIDIHAHLNEPGRTDWEGANPHH